MSIYYNNTILTILWGMASSSIDTPQRLLNQVEAHWEAQWLQNITYVLCTEISNKIYVQTSHIYE